MSQEATGLLERSSLYRELLAERQEMLRHKWLESEKAGQDIGFEQALVSWVVHQRQFQNPVAADVSPLKLPGTWSGVTSAATVLKAA